MSNAYADTSSKNMSVNASVPNNCNFNSEGGGGGSTISFGTYDPISAQESNALNSTMSFNIRCNKGTAVSIRLDAGQHADGPTRRLYANGEYLNYELYQDAAYTQVWGESPTNDMQYTSSSSAPHTPTVYARIAPGQDVSIGTYTDSVTVTASF